MGHEREREQPADADLVRRAKGGDKSAFAELVLRHWDTTRVLAEQVLRDSDLARDASQEACVIAMVSLDRLRTADRFGPWLCGIALNVARRWLRELRALAPLDGIDPPDTAAGPDEAAEAAFVSGRVRQAIAALAPGQRAVVLLFYLQGLTQREVAAELGISIGAVKARLHQARAVLAPRLIDETEEVPAMTTSDTTTPAWVDVSVSEVRRAAHDDPTRRVHVVILQETGGARRQLPIWTGEFEAVALAGSLENAEMPRPMTYQFTAALLDAGSTSVQEVRITQLTEGVFYAVVVAANREGRHEVDARPSDALNLAAIVGAPIRIAGPILDGNATHDVDWAKYPISSTELVAEARERYRLTARMLEHETESDADSG